MTTGNVASTLQSEEQHGWPELSSDAVFARDVLLSHFLNGLWIKVEYLAELVENGSSAHKILVKVRNGIAEFRDERRLHYHERMNSAWTNAFRLELLLALAEPPKRLLPELQARLAQADEEKVAGAARLRGILQQMTASQDQTHPPVVDADERESRLRSLLIDIIQGIQWQLTRKYAFRNLQREATRKIIYAAAASFALFLLPYIAIFFVYWEHDGNLDEIRNWIGLPLLTALAAGLFGAYFSRLLYLQKNWSLLEYDELAAAGELASIILRGIIGICGSAIVFFLLHAGIITGSFVPDFSNMTIVSHIPPDHLPATFLIGKELSLLIVWSFIAGFSERLVPSILGRTEARLDSSPKPPNQPNGH
ncbi:hypothetical protein GR211_00045 [Rhizobium leguminosarum]|uniref:hypothetical protein n=1 Tax=Rhizobium ruizarguesonis TaxID=2081791 RepID=UPI0013B7DC9A|nr:hypothetical protein [Rhizobium ruizarguesonis]NEJ15744.1 hypothetical protein [Rhizobium ruizarguesonis]NEK25290.1 hypothetical protein [Rhizobium ruizarguesonis]